MAFIAFDDRGLFVQQKMQHKVRSLALRGVGANTLAQILSVLLQVASTIILARILTPNDFGLVAMVSTFSLLLLNAGLNGFTEAILQSSHLDRQLTSNLFWINVVLGLVFSIVFACCGRLMAAFYHNDLVIAIAAAVSLSIFATSTSVIHAALLMRGMRFPDVYANQIAGRIVSVSISIMLALLGFRYWALVAGAVAQPVSESVGVWVLCRWTPSLPRRWPGTREMVKFALHVYGRFSFNYLTRNTDNLLVGWKFNAQTLGFYKKAYDMFAMSETVKSFNSVAIAALSRLRDDPEMYKQYVLRALSLTALVGMGIGGAVTLGGRDLIRILLGNKWSEAGVVFSFFGPGFGLMFIYGTHSWVHLSLGRPDKWLRWGVIECAVTLSLFIVGLHWGAAGVATSWTLSLLVLTLPAVWYAGRPVKLTFSSIMQAIWRFVAAGLIAGALTTFGMSRLYVTSFQPNLADAVWRLLASSLIFSFLYILMIITMHGSIAPLRRDIRLVRELRPFAKSQELTPMLSDAQG